jgi:tetratricopeptide (TPR) repeat protein
MRSVFIIMAICLLMLSCSKEKERSTPPPISEEKTLFEEVKTRTMKNPKDAEAWYHLADLYERSALYTEEADALNKVIALQPDNRYVYMKLGTVYSRLGRYPDAIKNFQKAKRFFPKNAVLYNNLAIAYGKIGKHDEEIVELKHAIALRPRYATARFNLGVVYLKKGQRKEAMKQYDELLKFDEGVAASLKQEIDAPGK